MIVVKVAKKLSKLFVFCPYYSITFIKKQYLWGNETNNNGTFI